MASKTFSSFTALPHGKQVYSARKGALRCSAIKLKDNSICLYSPVLGLGEDALASLAEIGPVTYLFAPNHYHNKGLIEYSKTFPKAVLVAHSDAAQRLHTQTGLSFQPADELKALLPTGMKMLIPEGLKTGEVWLTYRYQKQTSWLVADAFAGGDEVEEDLSNAPGFLKTFPNFGVKDKDVYSKWVKKQLKAAEPKCLIPCHGPVCQDNQLHTAMTALIVQHFG